MHHAGVSPFARIATVFIGDRYLLNPDHSIQKLQTNLVLFDSIKYHDNVSVLSYGRSAFTYRHAGPRHHYSGYVCTDQYLCAR